MVILVSWVLVCVFLVLAEVAAVCVAGEWRGEGEAHEVWLSDAATCTYTDKGGYTYDLSKLTQKAGGEDFSYVDGTKSYFVNFCANTVTETCKPASPVCNVVGSDVYSMGVAPTTWETQNPADGKSVGLAYGGGTYCSTYKKNRSTKIIVSCASSGASKITKVEEKDCLYTVSFQSPYGCGTKGSSPPGTTSGNQPPTATPSITPTPVPCVGNETDCGPVRGKPGGWIFVAIVIGTIVAYFVIGGVVTRMRASPDEEPTIIVHKEFWSSFPGLVKDGAVFAFYKITCREVPMGYQPLAP